MLLHAVELTRMLNVTLYVARGEKSKPLGAIHAEGLVGSHPRSLPLRAETREERCVFTEP